MPLRVVLAGRVVPDLHFGVAYRIGQGQENTVGQNDAQDQAVEPGVLHSPDCKPPDGVGARKDAEGEVPSLRLYSQRLKTAGRFCLLGKVLLS